MSLFEQGRRATLRRTTVKTDSCHLTEPLSLQQSYEPVRLWGSSDRFWNLILLWALRGQWMAEFVVPEAYCFAEGSRDQCDTLAVVN
jgi:hypothetical protein